PYAQSVAAAAQILPHDIETEEGKARTVIDAGDGRSRRAFKLGDQEALRIDCGKAGVIGEARIPAFGCGPVHGDGDFVRPHRPNAQTVGGGRSCRAHDPISPRVIRYWQPTERDGTDVPPILHATRHSTL